MSPLGERVKKAGIGKQKLPVGQTTSPSLFSKDSANRNLISHEERHSMEQLYRVLEHEGWYNAIKEMPYQNKSTAHDTSVSATRQVYSPKANE